MRGGEDRPCPTELDRTVPFLSPHEKGQIHVLWRPPCSGGPPSPQYKHTSATAGGVGGGGGGAVGGAAGPWGPAAGVCLAPVQWRGR